MLGLARRELMRQPAVKGPVRSVSTCVRRLGWRRARASDWAQERTAAVALTRLRFGNVQHGESSTQRWITTAISLA